ncbi:alpha/beta fold hydrolase [Streptomyces mesophilus]|uniref:alpha/beta fold hydrolase n=1 Tax=Streptomyces mesophilus TaxID=1775132 RepID=UPI003322A5E6
MPVISTAGTKVPYSVVGSGPGLVLLHGTNSDGASAFGHLAPRFPGRRVVTPDYAGSGASTIPDGPLQLEVLVQQAAAVARTAAEEPVDLLGHSLGAVVAAALAADHPELIRRLVLIAPWADGEDPRHRLVFETWRRLEDVDPELSLRYGLSVAFSPRFLSGLGHDRLAQLAGGTFPPATDRRIDLDLRLDLRDRLPRIIAPTLVIGLTQDYLVPAERAMAVHAAIPSSRYAELDSGHAVLLEQPGQLLGLVRDFLDKEHA